MRQACHYLQPLSITQNRKTRLSTSKPPCGNPEGCLSKQPSLAGCLWGTKADSCATAHPLLFDTLLWVMLNCRLWESRRIVLVTALPLTQHAPHHLPCRTFEHLRKASHPAAPTQPTNFSQALDTPRPRLRLGRRRAPARRRALYPKPQWVARTLAFLQT